MSTSDQLRLLNSCVEEALQMTSDKPDSVLHRLLEMASQEIWEQMRQMQKSSDRAA